MYVRVITTVHATNLMIFRDQEETFACPHFKAVLPQLQPQEVTELSKNSSHEQK